MSSDDSTIFCMTSGCTEPVPTIHIDDIGLYNSPALEDSGYCAGCVQVQQLAPYVEMAEQVNVVDWPHPQSVEEEERVGAQLYPAEDLQRLYLSLIHI